MINKETSKVTYTTVADASAPYAVPFEFYTAGPGSTGPELLVTLNGATMAYGTDYTLTDAGLVLVKAHAAGENLVIERDIPLTQEQDYQVGYIDPEQVEVGFDRSVMRDQMLADRISENEEDIVNLTQEVEDVRDIAQDALAVANFAEQTANKAAKDAVDAKNTAAAADQKAQSALDSVGQLDKRVTKNTQDIATNASAIRTNTAAIAETRTTANQAKNAAADAQATADSAFAKANKNAADITVLKQDQMDLGDQVHEIEAKIPGDASTTNQLATKNDLAKIDALPSQAGNAGKFLTTNGTDASWADVKQGSGIEWFKKLSATVTADKQGQWNELFFEIPKAKLIDGHVYEFYTSCVGLPEKTDGVTYTKKIFTNKVRYTKFFVDGDAIYGMTYFASQNEQSYQGNVTPMSLVQAWRIGPTTNGQTVMFDGINDTASEEFIYGTVGTTYQNMSITKIHDITNDTYIEPQNVGQSLFDTRPTYNMLYDISREVLLNVNIPTDEAVQMFAADNPVFGIGVGPFFMSGQGWTENRGVLTLCIHEVEADGNNVYNTTLGDYTFDFIISGQPDNVIVKEVHKSGSYADKTIECSRNNGDDSRLNVYFSDKSSLHTKDQTTNTMVIATLVWYGQPSGGNTSFQAQYQSASEIPTADIAYSTIPAGGTGDYVEKDQGADNAGKFLKVGPDGQVIASAESASGGLLAVAHDDTLSGAGTDADPLRVSGSFDDYLPLSGGTMTGPLKFETSSGDIVQLDGQTHGVNGKRLVVSGGLNADNIVTWGFFKTSNYDTFIALPNKSGTLATLDDIPSGSSTDDNGLEGDYCSRYGIVDETQSGLPTIVSGKTIKIPAGLVMDIPGVPGLTINSSDITFEIPVDEDCEVFLANGEPIAATHTFFSEAEKSNGEAGYDAWWNGTEWKFKSNDTGNVYRAANAVRIAKCVFTDGNLTRLCFTGCRLLNKQEFLSNNGGVLGAAIKIVPNAGTFGMPLFKDKLGRSILETDNFGNMKSDLSSLYIKAISPVGTYTFCGSSANVWTEGHFAGVYTKKINNGADINIPTTGGTMALLEDIPDSSSFATKDELSGYMATSGGTFSGPITFGSGSNRYAIGMSADGSELMFSKPGTNQKMFFNGIGFCPDKDYAWAGLGEAARPWYSIYTKNIQNGSGGSIAVPATGGTMALTSDIPDVSNLATKTEVEAKADKSEIPDVSGFQTAAQVTTIATNTTNGIISNRFQVVDALPATPDANTFYFVKKAA